MASANDGWIYVPYKKKRKKKNNYKRNNQYIYRKKQHDISSQDDINSQHDMSCQDDMSCQHDMNDQHDMSNQHDMTYQDDMSGQHDMTYQDDIEKSIKESEEEYNKLISNQIMFNTILNPKEYSIEIELEQETTTLSLPKKQILMSELINNFMKNTTDENIYLIEDIFYINKDQNIHLKDKEAEDFIHKTLLEHHIGKFNKNINITLYTKKNIYISVLDDTFKYHILKNIIRNPRN